MVSFLPTFLGPVIADGDLLVVADVLGAVVADTGGLVIFDDVVLVLLGMNVELLRLPFYPRSGFR
jgi:hypothetical protein